MDSSNNIHVRTLSALYTPFMARGLLKRLCFEVMFSCASQVNTFIYYVGKIATILIPVSKSLCKAKTQNIER